MKLDGTGRRGHVVSVARRKLTPYRLPNDTHLVRVSGEEGLGWECLRDYFGHFAGMAYTGFVHEEQLSFKL